MMLCCMRRNAKLLIAVALQKLARLYEALLRTSDQLCQMPTLLVCVCRQKSKDIEVDLWRFETSS